MGRLRGRRRGNSEEGNGVASPLSSVFSPILPVVRLTPATVDHRTLSAGIRVERRGSNFWPKEDQGFTTWMAQLRSFGCKASSTK